MKRAQLTRGSQLPVYMFETVVALAKSADLDLHESLGLSQSDVDFERARCTILLYNVNRWHESMEEEFPTIVFMNEGSNFMISTPYREFTEVMKNFYEHFPDKE